MRFQTLLAVFALALPGRDTLGAQVIGSYDRSVGRYMLGVVRERLEKEYYDPTFHGIDLRASAARADSQIRAAQSNSQIFMIIAQYVQDLDDSHTTFFPPTPAADVEYGWELQMIGDSCYVVRVEPASDAAAKGLRVGDRVLTLDGYRPTRSHFHLLRHFLGALSLRPVVRFVIESSDSSQRTLDIQTRITRRQRITNLLTIIRESEKADRHWGGEFSRVGGDVLVLRPGSFGEPREIDQAMRQARGAGTLILDLRGNGGGYEDGLVRLVGHVFDRRLVIATIHRRRETRDLESRPVGQPFSGRLYVLIDSRSASASEVFARLVQLEGRGVVLGDVSAGLVMRSVEHFMSVGERIRTLFALSVTDADVIMSDGSRLERRGVEPDALLRPTPADLAAGRDPVLALALEMAGHPMDPARAGSLLPRRP